MNRRDSVNEMKAVWAILNADLDLAIDYGESTPSAYAKRAVTRTLFAAVEGLSYQLRQVTLASIGHTSLLSQAEKSLLREERHHLDDKGQPKTSQAFLAFPQSLLFSIGIYAKNHGATFTPDMSTSGWQAMKQAIHVRNRVTHPKSAASLEVSNTDFDAVTAASAWWHATMLELFSACEAADERIRNEGTHNCPPPVAPA